MPFPEQSSSALLVANARLAELRVACRQQMDDSGQNIVQRNVESVQPVPVSVTAVYPPSLPSHLGWESVAISDHLRQVEARRPKADKKENGRWWEKYYTSRSHSKKPPHDTHKENIQIPQTTLAKLYPDIGLGMLRQELAAPGRIWLLLRCYDVSGRGWVDVTQARAMLTGKEAVLKVCGWRQLRNLF
ncbi:MAG: hypothetical protein GY805_12535, partial [Chloroflexi bacterium]|nr:hypothetical protein [Chloroflexota bacterium]